MLKMRAQQMEAFDKMAEMEFEARLAAYLREEHGEDIGDVSDDLLRYRVRTAFPEQDAMASPSSPLSRRSWL